MSIDAMMQEFNQAGEWMLEQMKLKRSDSGPAITQAK